ncbi:MAG TPA: SMP-30/gluconolactonase/LRE family protein [Acidimicrobiales bacterium]
MPNTLPDSLQYQILASGFDHVEGVCWDPVRQCIWAGGEAGQVYRVELDGTVNVVTVIDGGVLLGIALDQAGSLYICDPGNHRVWKLDDHYNAVAFGDEINYPNYPAFAPNGLLYVSDSGQFDRVNGRLFTIDAAGVTVDVSPRALEFANGIAIDDTTLWIVESAAPCVSSMSLTGGALDRTIPLERCVPDGLAFDAVGGLLISCYQPNQLWRWTPGEGLELIFDEWSGELILSPTNIAFYGNGLDRLALASLCGHNLVTIAAPQRGARIRLP